LPERVVRANNWRFLISAMPDGLDENERDRYRQAWARPNAMTSMINWYRALLRGSRKSTPSSKIRVPTLVLWGQQDPHISYQMAPLSVDLCEDGRLVTFQDAAHWVLHDKPSQVSQLLIEHFSHEDQDAA
jgi:pimeloyl-ACP methyl ester carboxylesterase